MYVVLVVEQVHRPTEPNGEPRNRRKQKCPVDFLQKWKTDKVERTAFSANDTGTDIHRQKKKDHELKGKM